jgi:hypothetical protein
VEANYGAWRRPIGDKVWERLSASMIAAGKPLPQAYKIRLHRKPLVLVLQVVGFLELVPLIMFDAAVLVEVYGEIFRVF